MRAQEKQAKTPALDKGCHGNPSPLGHQISRESTESVCLDEWCIWSCWKQKSYVIRVVLAIGGQRKSRLRNRASCFFFWRSSVRLKTAAGPRVAFSSPAPSKNMWEHQLCQETTSIPPRAISKEANRIRWVVTPIKSDLSSKVNSFLVRLQHRQCSHRPHSRYFCCCANLFQELHPSADTQC